VTDPTRVDFTSGDTTLAAYRRDPAGLVGWLGAKLP
jgi:hypothetical protein